MKDQSRFEYSPVKDRDFKLPNGENVAVWIIFNVEHFKIDVPSTAIYPPGMENTPDVLNYGWRDYGPRAGIWRMMDILDKHDLRATVTLNSQVCENQPEIVEAGMERDYEFMAHGRTNSEELAGMDEERERKVIREARDQIKEFMGEEPKGWLGPALAETFNTPDLLAEAGFDYVCDWCNDDQPYWMNVDKGSLMSVPYSIEINDIPMYLTYGMSGEDFEQAVKDQFDVLYEEGKQEGDAKVMAIALHPFISGVPHRSKYLDKVLDYITDHDDVWFTTGGEIAEHFKENYPES